MYKRIIGIALILVLVFGFSGCSSIKTSEEDTLAVMAAIDKFAACKSFTVKQITESTEVATSNGEKFVYDGNSVVEFSIINEPEFRLMNSKTITVKTADGEVEQSTISYIVPENGVFTEYFTDGAEWFKVSTDDASYLSGFNAKAFTSAFFVDVLSFGKVGEDTLDSGKAVRYEGALGGADLMGMLESVGYFYNGIASMSENQQAKIKENLAKDLKPVTVKVWVDEASSYPVRFEVSMTGMLENLEESISKTLGNMAQGDWAITDYVVTMIVEDFDAVEGILLPADAANAKVYEG